MHVKGKSLLGIMRWIIALLIFIPAVHANMVISQVLYDPIGSERGGEAIELRNDGTTAIDISGWVIATEASAADATIPEGVIIDPGSTFLIADTGWSSEKDDSEWKGADHEETITLSNTDAGVAIKDSSGTIIDAVGWGDADEIKQGLFEGTPATKVATGSALIRTQDTNNNVADLMEQVPLFVSEGIVIVVVNVTNRTNFSTPQSFGAMLDEDDSAEPGVQLIPVAGGTRALHLKAYYNGSYVRASWFEDSVELVNNDDVWTGELPLEYWYAAGPQEISIVTGLGTVNISVTILELKSVKLKTRTVLLDAVQGRTASGSIDVLNQGNVPVSVSWSGSDLLFGDESIPYANLAVEDMLIQPGETEKIGVSLYVPDDALPGEYRTILRMND